MNNNRNKPEASEEEYLRFFFENAKVSVQERIFIEEGFEICFNNSIPNTLKIDLNKEIKVSDRKTIRCPPPPSSKTPTPLVIDLPSTKPEIEEELPPDTEQEIQIPKAPKVPSMTMMGQILLDNAESGDYVLMNKQSGEHVSLGQLIDQLKELTGVE